MAAVINTNYLSLVAQNNLNKSQSSLGTAIERLSSGLRINSAKDDAAGMAIANRFTANVKGLTQAARNANDGISLAQTTEGAASEVNTHLQRVRELSVQASNGSYSQEQLDSMQDEINQRLSDIDRISQQTDFNGVKVLSSNAKPLTLQVGANDGETITLNLSEISVKTLGLDGFNVNGKGVTQNRTATVTDVLAANGNTAPVAGVYTVTTDNTVAKAADVFKDLANGNTAVATTSGTYTYDSAAGNFKYQQKVVAGDIATEAADLQPTTGTVTATFNNKAGASTSFEVDSLGNVTVNGKAAYLTAAGEITTNDPVGGSTQATLEDVLNEVAGSADATLTIGDRTYQQNGAADLEYNTRVSKEVVLQTMVDEGGTINLGSGVTTKAVAITATTGASDVYIDGKGALTNVASYDTEYTVNADNGEVTVVGGTSPLDGTTPLDSSEIGKLAYIGSDGKLTTSTTSAGDKTTDPMKTLDAAFTKLDKLTGELGAVQNRLESTIANLNNVVNNLSNARSRIQDADYATEVSNMSKAQILQQAGTSVLAQANQVPQTVLSLLR